MTPPHASQPSDPDEFRELLEKLLSREHVLLYDETGTPVLKNSDLWKAGEPT
jgi:hypothetical protein